MPGASKTKVVMALVGSAIAFVLPSGCDFTLHRTPVICPPGADDALASSMTVDSTRYVLPVPAFASGRARPEVCSIASSA
jgi:hypothetical protein